MLRSPVGKPFLTRWTSAAAPIKLELDDGERAEWPFEP